MTTHSNLRTFPILSHPCPILTYLPHMSLTHLNSPLLSPSSHKEKHPHLLTKHVHTTYIQRPAHIIMHHTWLTQPLQHTTYLTHLTYMNPTLLSIPHYSAPPFLLTSHKFSHSIVYVHRIPPTHVAKTQVTIQPLTQSIHFTKHNPQGVQHRPQSHQQMQKPSPSQHKM